MALERGLSKQPKRYTIFLIASSSLKIVLGEYMSIPILFFCVLSIFSIEGMNKTLNRSKTASTHFEKAHINMCGKILTLLKSGQEEGDVYEACVHIESLMTELNNDAFLLIMVLNRCGIVDELKRHADKGHPYASYLVCYLFEDKRKNERSIYKYLTVASKMFPRAAIWLLSCETDAPKVLEAIDRCQNLFQTLTDRQRAQVFAKLRIMVVQNQRGALRRFVRWSIAGSDTSTELAEFFSGRARNGLTSDIDQVIDSMYQELLSYGAQHPEVAYSLSQVFAKRAKATSPHTRTWQTQAEELCRSAQRQDYVPAQWRYMAVDRAQLAKDKAQVSLKALIERTRSFLAEHKSDSCEVRELISEVRSAVKVLEKDAKTFEECELLADIYLSGIPQVLDLNEAHAHKLLKAGYTVTFQSMQGRALVESCIQEFKRVEGLPNASHRRTVLVKFLVDEAVIRDNLEALSLLCRMYAFGLYGMEPSPLELVNVCITTHMVMQRKHPDERKMFLKETGLEKLLDMPVDAQHHHPASYFVLGLIWGSSATLEQADQERYKRILCELEDQYSEDENYYELLYVLGPIEHLLSYLDRGGTDLETAFLAANLVVHRSHKPGIAKKSPLQRKVLNITLQSLSPMIAKARISVEPSFIPSSPQAELLRNKLKAFIDKVSAEQQAVTQDVVRAYALLELFVGSDLLSRGFCNGVALLGQLSASDELSRRVLPNLQHQLLLLLGHSRSMEVPLKKLQCLFALIFVEIHMPDDHANAAEHFRQCLYYVRQQSIEDYESWSDIHDPADLFGHMLKIPSPNHIALSIRLRFHVYLSAHYACVAGITSDAEKAAALLKKSQSYLEKGHEVHSLIMNLVLTAEYLIGRAVAASADMGKQCYAAATKIMHSRKLDIHEKKSMVLHSTELLQAAQDLAIQDQQFLDDVQRTKSELAAELKAI